MQKSGIKTVMNIFPTLVALFLAINALRNSGILDFIQNILSPFLAILKIPSQVFPLMLIRPISGSASTAIALDIMKTSGVDSTVRTYCIDNYGVYRNNLIYNRHLYKHCKNKEYTLCFICCTTCRYCSE